MICNVCKQDLPDIHFAKWKQVHKVKRGFKEYESQSKTCNHCKYERTKTLAIYRAFGVPHNQNYNGKKSTNRK